MIGILLQNCHIPAMPRGFEKRISRNLPFPLAGRTVLWAVDKNQEAREKQQKERTERRISIVYTINKIYAGENTSRNTIEVLQEHVSIKCQGLHENR